MNTSFVALLSRFGAVGIAATLTYLVIANSLIWAGLVPTVASVVGYLAGMVASFLGQSRFTFQMKRTGHRHLVRYCFLSLVGLLISYMAVWVAHAADAPPVLGTVATAILVPILSFVVMKLWVFREN